MGEAGTEELFLILAGAFSKANVKEMKAVLKASHKIGAGSNMLRPMADKIEASMSDQLAEVRLKEERVACE